MADRALTVENLHVRYGGINAVKGVSFHVDAGEIVTLIGANGAGKSSTLKSIVGLVKGEGGISAFGTDLTKTATHDVAGVGVQLVPEGRAIFGNLTVEENLDLGAYSHRFAGASAEREKKLDEIFALFPRLKERLAQTAGTLSGGEQQMLAIGRALMALPKMILLDEPSLGLAPKLVTEIFAGIRDIAARGTTILLVEQNFRMACALGDRVAVMDNGRVVHAGGMAELAGDETLQQRLLGLSLGGTR